MGVLSSKPEEAADDFSVLDENDDTAVIHRMLDEEGLSSSAQTASEPMGCCVAFKRRALAINAMFRHNISGNVDQFAADADAETPPMAARDAARIKHWADEVISMVDATLDCPVQTYAIEQETRRALRELKRGQRNATQSTTLLYSPTQAADTSTERSSQAATSVGVGNAIAQIRAAQLKKQEEEQKPTAASTRRLAASSTQTTSMIPADVRNMSRSITSTVSHTENRRRQERVYQHGSEDSSADGSVTLTTTHVSRGSAEGVLSRRFHVEQSVRRAAKIEAVRRAKYGGIPAAAQSRRSGGSRFSFTDSEGSDVLTADDIREHPIRMSSTPLEQAPATRPDSFAQFDLSSSQRPHQHHHPHRRHHRSTPLTMS